MTQAAQLAQYGANNVGLSFKNRIINGDMTIDQRNAGASVNSPSTAALAYTLDRWEVRGDTEGVFSIQQNSSAPAGFVNSLKITVTTIDSSLGATQLYNLSQKIEGYNVADLGWGTANAKTVTVSFWVRSSVTGTFGGSLRNSAANRSYPFTYTISVADTWEQKSVTIAGDTSGTWLTTNGIGITLLFSFGAGTDRSGTAGAWVAANNSSATGATNLMATLNATWQITGVQLEVGTVATSFDYLPYGTELMLCQRYCINYRSADAGSYMRYGSGYSNSATNLEINVHFPVTMRTSPTLTVTSTPSNYSIYIGGGQAPCSTVPVIDNASDNPSVSTVSANSASTFSSSGGGSIISAANGTSYMLFTAEL